MQLCHEGCVDGPLSNIALESTVLFQNQASFFAFFTRIYPLCNALMIPKSHVIVAFVSQMKENCVREIMKHETPLELCEIM